MFWNLTKNYLLQDMCVSNGLDVVFLSEIFLDSSIDSLDKRINIDGCNWGDANLEERSSKQQKWREYCNDLRNWKNCLFLQIRIGGSAFFMLI